MDRLLYNYSGTDSHTEAPQQDIDAGGGVLLRIAMLCAQVPIAPSATVGALLESVTKRATKKLGEKKLLGRASNISWLSLPKGSGLESFFRFDTAI